MQRNCIALLYIFQIVHSLDLATRSLPITSNNKLNKGRHKASRPTVYPIESVVDTAFSEAHESYFPDVTYPTNILEAAELFYYPQQGYDELLGPFSNDLKSTYKKPAVDKSKSRSTDYSTLQHKNGNLLNTTSNNNDTSSNTPIENYQYSLLEDEQGTSKLVLIQNCTNTEETMPANNTVSVINEQTYQDVSEEDSMNEQDLNVEYIEECINFLSIEKDTTPSKDLLERYTNSTNSNEDHVTSNHFMFSDIHNQDDTQSLYTKDINKSFFINLIPNYFVISNTSSSQDSEELLDTVHSNNTPNENVTSNYFATSDTNNDRNESETQNIVMLINETSNQEDTELSETINEYITEDCNFSSNIVVTSSTGNTREDFVSDIMNIYSLIEETLRANVNSGSTTNSESHYYNVRENN